MAGLLPEAAAGGREESRGRPSILVIMTDQHRYDAVGANGNPIIQTPHLDRLASESACFQHAFVNAPVCVPSRASLFTGRYAHAHRNRVNYTPLKPDQRLMQLRLREAGYRTSLVGKTHLFHAYPPTPAEAARTGFDHVALHDGVRFTDAWSDYAQWRNQHDPLRRVHYRTLARDVPEVENGRNPYRAAIDEQFTDTSWVGTVTCRQLRSLSEHPQPFYLFSSFWKPHSPFEVPVPFDSLYNDATIPLPRAVDMEQIRGYPPPVQKLALRGKNPPWDMPRERLQWIYRSYYGSITHIDREIGRILDTLRDTGQADNTVVVFTSDHGDQLLEHGIMGKNVFYEGSLRVPFMLRYQGHVVPGSYEPLVESVDLLPTLFGLAGLEEPYDCQGQSLVPLITRSDQPWSAKDAVFSENVIPEIITGGSLDFVFEKGRGVKGIRHPDAKSVRTKRWKFNYYPNGAAELFDLLDDPAEDRNLAQASGYAATVADMKERLLHWLVTASETDQIAPRWVIP